MKILSIFVSLLVLPSISWALSPLDGVILGRVYQQDRYDPIEGLLNLRDSYGDIISPSNRLKLKKYYYHLTHAVNLKNRCENRHERSRYLSKSDENEAKKTLMSNLQYIGLDFSARAIGYYANKTDLSEGDYRRLVDRLIKSSCSENISVYGHRLIKNNLLQAYNNPSSYMTDYENLDAAYTKNFRQHFLSLTSQERRFELSLHNFRAFCSWGNQDWDSRLLAPYLANAPIMSRVIDFILQRSLVWNPLKGSFEYEKKATQKIVGCYQHLCRPMQAKTFKKEFPLQMGPNDLLINLENLYCDHFYKMTYRESVTSKKIAEWIDDKGLEMIKFEVSHFYSLLEQVPEVASAADTYLQLAQFIHGGVKSRFNSWALQSLKDQSKILLYEEPLRIELIPNEKNFELLQNPLAMSFRYSSGEYDRELYHLDKLFVRFNLEFEERYLLWIKERKILISSRGNKEAMQSLKKRVQLDVLTKLKKTESVFLQRPWSDDFALLVADELFKRIERLEFKHKNRLSHNINKIPIRLEYGTFALGLIHSKFQTAYRSEK